MVFEVIKLKKSYNKQLTHDSISYKYFSLSFFGNILIKIKQKIVKYYSKHNQNLKISFSTNNK